MKTQQRGSWALAGVVALAVGMTGAGLAAADPGDGAAAGTSGGAPTNADASGGGLDDGALNLWPSDHAADNVNLGPFRGGFDAGTAGDLDQGAGGGDGRSGDMPFLW